MVMMVMIIINMLIKKTHNKRNQKSRKGGCWKIWREFVGSESITQVLLWCKYVRDDLTGTFASVAFLLFAWKLLFQLWVALFGLPCYMPERPNYGNPCKFNKYSYLIELITFLMNQIFQLSQNAKIFIPPATDELDCVKTSLVKFTAIEAQWGPLPKD